MKASEFFCIPSSFLFLPLGVFCLLPVCFGLPFRHPFILIYIFSMCLPIRKKKKSRTIFKDICLIFLEQKFFGNLEHSEFIFYVFKYFLKITFIYSVLFALILHVCTVVF